MIPKKIKSLPSCHLKANPSSVVRVLSPEMEVRVARGACRACEVAPPAVAPSTVASPTVTVAAEAIALPHVPPEAAAGANALPRAAMAFVGDHDVES